MAEQKQRPLTEGAQRKTGCEEGQTETMFVPSAQRLNCNRLPLALERGEKGMIGVEGSREESRHIGPTAHLAVSVLGTTVAVREDKLKVKVSAQCLAHS